jgi:hypothetical protein
MTPRPFAVVLLAASAMGANAIDYTADDRMVVPADYRDWVFLTSSLDLNYNEPVPGAGRQSLLDNVFVDPPSYRAFLATGTWPDKTVLVKENRRAVPAGDIAKAGKLQAGVVSMELHVKDRARFPGDGWAFFLTDGTTPSRPMPRTAGCYSCHEQHGAVDTTFVQYYPTLIDVARATGTLRRAVAAP